MLECVVNVSEGRRAEVLDALVAACGGALLDVHRDPDHHRSVFTLAGPDTTEAVRRLATLAVERIDLRHHEGVHPRLGAVDVVPFVALGDTPPGLAVKHALAFAAWIGDELGVPAFLYGDADAQRRSLPSVRAGAFRTRPPDFGPGAPHPSAGATAVGARPPLVAVNCVLDRPNLEAATGIAQAVRERDGGQPGVRALAFALASRQAVQVSMNLVDLDATGLEAACTAVGDAAARYGLAVREIEVVGLIPAAELARCSDAFTALAHLGPDRTVEGRFARRGSGGTP